MPRQNLITYETRSEACGIGILDKIRNTCTHQRVNQET